MADLMKNMNEVYKKWESKSAPNLSARNRQPPRDFDKRRKPRQVVRGEQVKPTHFNSRRREPGKFPVIRRPRYRDLAQFKMAPSVTPLNKTRPFMGLSCGKCTPISRAGIPYPYIPSLPVCNMLVIPSGFCTVPVIFECFIPLYYIFHKKAQFAYPDVSCSILDNTRFFSLTNGSRESEDDFSSEENDEAKSKEQLLQEKTLAKKTLKTIKSSISPSLLRIACWLLHRLLGSILTGVYVHKGHIEMLKSINQDDIPIVYVPTHRSHLDYVLISFILFMNNLKVPLVAAGENLLIPVFGFILRRLGAFFVRRRLDIEPKKRDNLYRTVLQAYITECLKAGYSMEVFIEGGRSRNGKSKMPKTGLLSFIVESFMRGDIEDAYISPVSISYEKIVEGNFVQEQLGKDKVPESFFSTIRSLWTVLHSHFGSVRVDFGQPFSLKEFLRKADYGNIFTNHKIPSIDTPPSSPTSSSSSSGSICGKGPARRSLRTLINLLADHITYDSTSCTALMSTQLIAFLFLAKHRKGATQQQLLCSFDWLREELEKRKRDVGFTGTHASVIKHALSLLGKDLIGTEIYEKEWWKSSTLENTTMKFVIYKPVTELPYVVELQYYANAVVPVFTLDSIVVNALYSLLDADICYFHLCDSKFIVSRQALVDKAKELSHLFEFEFVLVPPCGDILSAVNDVIEDLITKEYLHVTGSIKHVGASMQKILTCRSNYYSFEPSDEEEGFNVSAYSQQLKVDLSEESIDYLEFMRNVVGPFIECYWLASCTLLKLIHTTMEENDFLKAVQETAQEKLCLGLLHFEESFAMEVMKNALKLFLFWQVVDYKYEGSARMFYIIRHCGVEYSDAEQSECDTNEHIVQCQICFESVSNVISRIEEFRK